MGLREKIRTCYIGAGAFDESDTDDAYNAYTLAINQVSC